MDVAATLKSGGERGSSGRRLTARSALVVAQVALSLMLLLASGLLLRGYLGLQAEDPGFRPGNLVVSPVSLPAFKYESAGQVGQTWDEVLLRARSVPGVLAVGAIDYPPPRGIGPYNSVWAAQRPPASAADRQGATRRFVTDGFFDAMGIAVRAGRVFGPGDEQAGQPVTVINETLARQFFPNEDPLGQTLVLEWPVDLTVLGVVADIREQGPGTTTFPTFYLPAWLTPRLSMYLVARTNESPLAVAGALRSAVRAAEPDIPDAPVQTMEGRLSASLFQPKFRSTLVAAFALVSLVLAAIGLYGVLAYFVRRHGHELGIRLALGASGAQAARLVLARGLALAGSGIVIGLAGGYTAMRFVLSRGWLSGIDLVDPPTYAGVALALLLVALCACAVPALRALRLDPRDVMRTE